jgi:hypothetical protein
MRKGAATVVLMAIILSCTLAFALGLVLAGKGEGSLEYRTAMESLRLDVATKMGWIKIVFWGGLTTIIIIGLGGAVWGLLRAIWRRSRLIYPQPTGLFPIVEGQAGGQIYYHDPNRQWAGTTAYEVGPEGVTAHHLIPPGQEEAQLQIATQAQATQFVAAANQGRGLSASTRRLVEKAALPAPHQAARRLPQVVVLDETIPEERRLVDALRRDWEEGE